jgi:two-component system, OmpR family, phosphate regulon sensor histidine kinase PhoR
MLKMKSLFKNCVILSIMKRSPIQLYLLILTFICLIFLVGIQINWIMKAARMQETQFNRSVTMAMNRIVENLARDQAICNEVTNCLRKDSSGSCKLMMKNRTEWTNIGTMIKSDLKFYGIDLDFEFDIVDKSLNPMTEKKNNVYFTKNLEDVLNQAGYELKIRFPDKSDFIKAQIGYIFICSLVLLLLVSVSFLLIFRYYRREKRLTENIVDIINNMTHEFRTPLTNIALANSMISRNEVVEKDEKLSSYSKIIRTEHNRLKSKVEELLKTSFSGLKSVSNDVINISEVVGNVIETYSVQLKSKNGKVELHKPDSDLFVKGNIDSFHIAIGNLLDNAIKYNTGSPEIIITLKSIDKLNIIDISDNGIGIPREYQLQIFDKYFRVPTGDIHNSNGFGLGLYYVNDIIKGMGGRIKVSSSQGKGTRFTIEIPENNIL